jgi:hypothetical protein
MRRNASAALSLAIIVCVALVSCYRKPSQSIQLEETPVISGGLGWGVVTLAYVRLMLMPSVEAPDSGTARRGDVVRVIARSRSFAQRDKGVWYRVEIGSGAGWIHESSLAVFRSEAEARKSVEASR